MKILRASLALCAMVAFAPVQIAQAAFIPCSAFETNRVVQDGGSNPNAGCGIGNVNNDSEASVNGLAGFGFTDWILDAKDNDLNGVDEGSNSSGFSITGNALSGNWSFTNFGDFANIMLVIKGGNSGTQPNYAAYLLDWASGTYSTHNINPNNENPKNISHLSVYVRGKAPPPPPPPPPAVPEPGTLALLGLGLVGIGFSRRRKIA